MQRELILAAMKSMVVINGALIALLENENALMPAAIDDLTLGLQNLIVTADRIIEAHDCELPEAAEIAASARMINEIVKTANSK